MSLSGVTMVGITLKGILRDRVFRGIIATSMLFVAIPAISSLSMRQVTELAITLSLSLVSFVLLLLAVFLGGASLWKDMERRYTHSVLSLPLSRSCYLLGRFAGISLFLLGTAALLGSLAAAVVLFVTFGYPPDRPVAWGAFAVAIGGDALKCILLVAFAMLFSSLSTSFFLPIFGTIAIYVAGGASQQAYDYIHSSTGQTLDPLVRQIGSVLYYLLPNFSAFDFKVYATYALELDLYGAGLTLCYSGIYTALVLTLATAIFARRELV